METATHSITVIKQTGPWEAYLDLGDVWYAECTCGWRSDDHRRRDWKHPDVRALGDGEQHLMHMCPTCTAINQACSPKATHYMGKPPGTHELHDDLRFWCPIHTSPPQPKRPPVQRMSFKRVTLPAPALRDVS